MDSVCIVRISNLLLIKGRNILLQTVRVSARVSLKMADLHLMLTVNNVSLSKMNVGRATVTHKSPARRIVD